MAEETLKFDGDYATLIPDDEAKMKFARELEASLQKVTPEIRVADIRPGSIIAVVRGPSEAISLTRESASKGVSLPSFGALSYIPPAVPWCFFDFFFAIFFAFFNFFRVYDEE